MDWNNELEFYNDELLAVDDASTCSSADMAKILGATQLAVRRNQIFPWKN